MGRDYSNIRYTSGNTANSELSANINRVTPAVSTTSLASIATNGNTRLQSENEGTLPRYFFFQILHQK
jgi:hypothetical protein